MFLLLSLPSGAKPGESVRGSEDGHTVRLPELLRGVASSRLPDVHAHTYISGEDYTFLWFLRGISF